MEEAEYGKERSLGTILKGKYKEARFTITMNPLPFYRVIIKIVNMKVKEVVINDVSHSITKRKS